MPGVKTAFDAFLAEQLKDPSFRTEYEKQLRRIQYRDMHASVCSACGSHSIIRRSVTECASCGLTLSNREWDAKYANRSLL
jgi:ribosomal protein L37E